MGEAGSSFTFEVAQKNGLPFNLINRAKKKIERGKVRFRRDHRQASKGAFCYDEDWSVS